MSSTSITLIALAPFAVAIVAILAGTFRKGERGPDPAALEAFRNSRLSFLALLSFICGLAAILVVSVAGLFSLAILYGDVLRMEDGWKPPLRLAGRIVLFSSLLPAACSLAFGGAARGLIRESGGALRGAPLYRAGLLLALVSGFLVIGSRTGLLDHWQRSFGGMATSVRSAGTRGPDRGARVLDGAEAATGESSGSFIPRERAGAGDRGESRPARPAASPPTGGRAA